MFLTSNFIFQPIDLKIVLVKVRVLKLKTVEIFVLELKAKYNLLFLTVYRLFCDFLDFLILKNRLKINLLIKIVELLVFFSKYGPHLIAWHDPEH